MAATVAAFASVRAKPGWTASARARNRRIASNAIRSATWRQHVRVGKRQRRNREAVLAGEAQDVAAGDEHREARAGGQQGSDLGRGRHDVLEVVEDEQHLPLAQIIGQAVAQGTAAHLAQTQRLGDGGDDETRLAEGVEGHEPDPVRERIGHLGRDLDGQPGLANPAGAGEGQQADVGAEQQGGGRGSLALAADEGSERGRQIRSTGRKSGHGCADHVRGQAGAIIVGLRYAVNDGSDSVLSVSPFRPSAVARRAIDTGWEKRSALGDAGRSSVPLRLRVSLTC